MEIYVQFLSYGKKKSSGLLFVDTVQIIHN